MVSMARSKFVIGFSSLTPFFALLIISLKNLHVQSLASALPVIWRKRLTRCVLIPSDIYSGTPARFWWWVIFIWLLFSCLNCLIHSSFCNCGAPGDIYENTFSPNTHFLINNIMEIFDHFKIMFYSMYIISHRSHWTNLYLIFDYLP